MPMEYITHKRFHAPAMCSSLIDIPYGTTLEERAGILYTADGDAICYANSENGHMHFAPNGDGAGLLRGETTYLIAYSHRANRDGYRFNEDERKILVNEYSHWLRSDTDTILFNHEFFGADVDDLCELVARLHM